PRRELAQQRDRDLVRLRTARDPLLELAAGVVCDVHDGAERPRREERLACAPEDTSRPGLFVAEATQECGLPDSGLASGEDEAAVRAAGDRGEGVAQRCELVRALEELGLSRRRS